MSRSSTRKSLSGNGNFMGMMNVLMQLRKVCNHPDLFEPRAILTPFVMSQITFSAPVLAATVLQGDSLTRVSSSLTTNLVPTVFTHPNLDPTAVETLRGVVPTKDLMVVFDDRR